MRGLVGRLERFGYIPVLVLAMAMMFVRTLVAARLLDVEVFGQFGIGMLIANSLCMLGCFGLFPLLQRDLPILLVKGCYLRGMVLFNQALLLAIFVFLIGLVVSGFDLFSISAPLIISSLFNGLAQQLFLVVTLESRSRGRSLRYAVENLVRGTAVVSIVSLVALTSGSATLTLLAEALVTILISLGIYVQMTRESGINVMLALLASARGVRNVRWTSPLTLLAVGTFGFVMLNGDRWMAGVALDHGAFAMYTFAGVILMVGQSIQGVLNVSVFAVLARTYASTGTVVAGSRAKNFSFGSLLLFGLLAFPGYFAIEKVIDIGFPNFGGAKPLLIYFIPVAVLRMSDYWSSFMVIVGRERQLLILNLTALAVSLLVWLAIVPLTGRGPTMTDIASFALLVSGLNYLFIATASFVAVRARV